MNAKEFVDSLFEGYEQTAALADFKEELLANLNAKTDSLVKKGMDADAAFEKARAELGDVSAFADDLSLRKRKEVFEEVYMDIKKYIPARRAAAYLIFGIVGLFGIIVSLLAFFAMDGLNSYLRMCGVFGSLLPFLTTAAAGFTFLGVTQETASLLPVSGKRGAWYSAAAALIVFGLIIMPITYFGSKFGLGFAGVLAQWGSIYGSEIVGEILEETGNILSGPLTGVVSVASFIAPIIPFILPGIGILAFMILTEKNRLKPWAKDFKNKTAAQEMVMWQDPEKTARFGIFSGAIWIFAIGLFILLGFLISFRYSWLVFIFATAVQLLLQGVMGKKKNT